MLSDRSMIRCLKSRQITAVRLKQSFSFSAATMRYLTGSSRSLEFNVWQHIYSKRKITYYTNAITKYVHIITYHALQWVIMWTSLVIMCTGSSVNLASWTFWTDMLGGVWQHICSKSQITYCIVIRTYHAHIISHSVS